MLILAFSLIEGGINANYADARSRMGGRTFRMAPRRVPSRSTQRVHRQNNGSFRRGLAGGLLGGALGGMLFGSMFGMGGTGMGILPLLLLAGGAWYLFRRMNRPRRDSYSTRNGFGSQGGSGNFFDGEIGPAAGVPPVPEMTDPVEDGIARIREHDSSFDPDHFLEIASDVFFKVQAGWMRRDLDSFRHLLGDQLAREYEEHFAEMRRKGHINKLENIAIRNVKIVEAGSDGVEDFITVLFSANLLDYTVDDKSGKLVEGSMTEPVKFEERWTWARPVGTENWKLERIA